MHANKRRKLNEEKWVDYQILKLLELPSDIVNLSLNLNEDVKEILKIIKKYDNEITYKIFKNKSEIIHATYLKKLNTINKLKDQVQYLLNCSNKFCPHNETYTCCSEREYQSKTRRWTECKLCKQCI